MPHRKVEVGDLIYFRDPMSSDCYENVLFFVKENNSFGIIVETDIVMTQIYWQHGEWEFIPTYDLNLAVNVEIVE